MLGVKIQTITWIQICFIFIELEQSKVKVFFVYSKIFFVVSLKTSKSSTVNLIKKLFYLPFR